MPYILDMTKPHNQSLLELVNFDNAGSIETPLTQAEILIRDERAVGEAETLVGGAFDGELIAREFAVTLENKAYALDFVEVYFNKVNLADVMTMTSIDGDFDFYDPDTWVDGSGPTDSPALAVAAFKAAAARAGIDADVTMEQVVATRILNGVNNYFYVNIANQSKVFHTDALFKMPRHLSETITQTTLDGFYFTPIAPEDVVA